MKKARPRTTLALIVNTASYERVSFALGLAAAAAALGQKVGVLFGTGGLVRLRKGFVDQVGEETPAWIRQEVQSGLQKGGIPRISELLQDLRQLGGRVYACPAAMVFHNLPKEELVEEVEQVRGVVAFLTEEMKGASTTLYV